MDKATKLELDDLVVRFLQGESALIEPLMKLLGGPVYTFFIKLDIPRGDAPDVVSEFFQELFDKRIWRYQPQPESRFWSWLCVVIVNHARDWHKKEVNNLESAASDYIDTADARSALVARRVAPPSKRMALVLEAFEVALGALSTRDQDLLRLKEVVGLDYEELAETFEPGAAVAERKQIANRLKTALFRAKDKIRKSMELDPRVPREFFDGESKGEVPDVESERENQRGA